MCRFFFALTVAAAIASSPLSAAPAARDTLIIGDSLSKEYRYEGPALWSNATALKARNWMEILLALRSSDFSFGTERDGSSFGDFWPDSRFLGHEYNWAIPGSTTDDWQQMLNGGSVYQDFVVSTFNGHLRNNVARVVIFLGGNDLNRNYDTFYNGSNPSAFIADLLGNFRDIIAHVKSQNPALKIVIATVPDVGATPDVQSDHPDPVKRARVTSATESLNAGIRQLATDYGLGVADIYEFSRRYLAPPVISLGGVPFIKGVNSQNAPRYLISADSFHPNTGAQAIIAEEILRAFDEKFSAGVLPLSGAEIIAYLEDQHGTMIDINYSTWAAAYGVPQGAGNVDSDHDGVTDDVEFALALDPSTPDAEELPQGSKVIINGVPYLALTYIPRADYADYTSLAPQYSMALGSWNKVKSSSVINNGDGSFTARVPMTGQSGFLRLSITVHH